MVQHILVASYTDAVYTLAFDSSRSSLELVSSTTVGYHPSWITPHPHEPSVVFTGLEQENGRVVVLKYDANGVGTILGEISSGGKDPASLLATDDTLFVANYSSGTLLTTPLLPGAPYVSDARSSLGQLVGTGPNAARQEASHPHQVVFVPEREGILVPDLGADRTWRFKREEGRREWTMVDSVLYGPGDGPRHVVLKDNLLYTLCELTSTLTTHDFPPLPASSLLISRASTLINPPEPLGDMLASEIFIAPQNAAFPEPLLYTSNRNDPSPLGDTLAVFSLEKPTHPKLVSELRTGLKHLRGAALGGEDGRWIIAGGARGGGVKMFERVEGGRNIKEVAQIEIGSPTAFLWL
ncbi:hypothetical protein EVG20_g6120 [Dentipellis fragilis]|uniref:6-phosphogluconolactonase n=1 Tax=Dentipellis fragilis TaxID=205917 RepID=A0A4Y9YQH4_9AGAM|nr:hypothetical protein EVG20_g6120 [Dentipellis fragilis]